jgi:hypothetical protein
MEKNPRLQERNGLIPPCIHTYVSTTSLITLKVSIGVKTIL